MLNGATREVRVPAAITTDGSGFGVGSGRESSCRVGAGSRTRWARAKPKYVPTSPARPVQTPLALALQPIAAEPETDPTTRTGCRGPDRGRILRRRQHHGAGRVDHPLRPRSRRPQLLCSTSRPGGFRLEAGEVPGHRQGEQRRRRQGREKALSFVAGRSTERTRPPGRGDLRRGHRRQDLARHPRPGPDAPRRRPAGLAGHRDPGRAGAGRSPSGSV